MRRLALILSVISILPVWAQNPAAQPGDAEMRMAATQFASEVRMKCMDLKEKTNPAPIVAMFEKNQPAVKIRMLGPLKYDKPTGNCTGEFNVTHVESGSTRDFNLPLKPEDSKPL